VPEVKAKLDDLSGAERRQIAKYEHDHKNRKTLLEALRG
jgi:hypothetical protein